ncbi:MAG: hypothetical protein M1840_006442 [Geoglossum simile]|nr:MAG: hypothetical protein M1840_006442 [Geoglossum simile]
MPESPPKRITRARAKAAEKEPDAKGAKAAKVATSTKVTRTTKRKTRADEVEDRAVALEVPATTVDKPEPAKAARGRSRKVAAVTVETAAETILAEPMPSQASEPEPPKSTRGRSRRAVASTAKPEEPEKLDAARAKRAPRGRAAAVAAAAAAAAAAVATAAAAAAAAAASAAATTKAPIKSTAPKKKVTFQDDLDKENIVPSPDEFKQPPSEKAPEKAAGLKAKPVRRPASGRATRSSKKASAVEAEKTEEKEELPPLSPKKAKQIPVVQPASDEDELSGGKTPRKAFGKPSYGITSTRAETGEKNVSKLDFSTSLVALRQDKFSTADLLSSSRGLGSSLLATPARRPPSPVKSMFEESTLKKGGDPVQPSVMAPPPAFKDSLLQSPARRPLLPPVKVGIASGSPRKFIPTAAPTLEHPEAPSGTAEFSAPAFSPLKRISSPLRATKSSERPIKVHKISVEEEFEQGDIFQKSPITLLSAIELDPDRKKAPTKLIATKLSSAKLIKSSIPIKTPPASPKLDGFAMDIDSSGAAEPTIVEETEHIKRTTTPPGVPTQPTQPTQPPSGVSHPGTPTATRQAHGDSDYEDELQSESQDHSPTPFNHRPSIKRFGISSIPTPSAASRKPKGTPMRSVAKEIALANAKPTCVRPSQIFSITPLVSQFGTLVVRSPGQVPQEPVQAPRGLFSPELPKPSSSSFGEVIEPTRYSLLKSSFFDDEMLALEQQQEEEEEEEAEEPAPTEISGTSREYDDENSIPIDPVLLAASQTFPAVATPVKVFSSIPREVRTVQKVPLKPAADDTPTRSSLKRSASLSGLGSQRRGFIPSDMEKADPITPLLNEDAALGQQPALPAKGLYTPTKPMLSPQRTPGTAAWSNLCSPARTPRRYVDPETLKGAIVHVDVHTAEGADASGIFIELLTQMGARCVKQWNWNPSNNVPATADSSELGFGIGGSNEGIREAGTSGGIKIGITHVVFKDGGVRTLQKVRESKGVVVCVGVNWVLDCEREQKWLNEEDYAVDLSNIPRGGHRRRKSMEPRALANINGNLVPCDLPGPRASMSPTKEFLTFSSPPPVPMERRERRESNIPKLPTTPLQQTTTSYGDDGDMSPLSPTTPYFLKPTEMMQRTCPPKAMGGTGRLVFLDKDEGVRRRLLLARRKSLQWAPKVGSPLGRGVSFGE